MTDDLPIGHAIPIPGGIANDALRSILEGRI
jgi:hypothetical protein